MALNTLEIMNQSRGDALSSQDALKYFQFCRMLGIGPEDCEDEVLYGQGEAEEFIHKEIVLDYLEVQKQMDFLKDARGLMGGDSNQLYDARARVMQEHFSRFRDDGKQPLYKQTGCRTYNPGQLWHIFDSLCANAKKVTGTCAYR